MSPFNTTSSVHLSTFDNHNTYCADLDSVSVASSSTCMLEDCVKLSPKAKSLKLLNQNIRSVNCNIDGLHTILERAKVEWDLIILTECWLFNFPPIPIIQGYNVSTSSVHRTQNEGVIAYYNKKLTIAVSEPNLSDANCLVLVIDGDTVVVAIYRPPAKHNVLDFLESLNALLCKYSSFKNIILAGDMNIDISSESFDPRSFDYLNLMAGHGMLPAHSFPTRLQSCLDHVLLKTSKPAFCHVAHSSVTDHDCVILFLVKSCKLTHSLKTYRQIYYASLERDIGNIDFGPLFNMDDVNLATDYFTSSIRRAIIANSALRVVPNRKRTIKPWISLGLLRCLKNRDQMHLKLKKYPNDDILNKTYTRYRNFCSALLKKAKCEHEKSEIKKAGKNNKKLWNVIKNITNTSKSYTAPSELLSSSDFSPQTSINNVNSFFANLGQTLASNFDSSSDQALSYSSPSPNTFVLLPTDEFEIETLIDNLRGDCATGIDGIPSEVIKKSKCALTRPITFICNLAFTTGVFPDAFKLAQVLPVYKKGDRGCVDNYRPISILSSLSKILERLLNSRLNKYLEKNNLLSNAQYGFRSGISTNDAVHELTDFIVTKIDRKEKLIGIFIDLAKAFDTVSVPLLVSKLEKLGIRDTQLQIFQSYLTGRRQCVKIDNWTSDELPITYGVPQGSILGPSLFLVYIDTLCRLPLTNGRVFAYADDTALVFHANSWTEAFRHAQSGFDAVSNWLKFNVLTLNIDKCNLITFTKTMATRPDPITHRIIAHRCSSPDSLDCDCPNILCTDCVKYLGVLIDGTLTFKPQIIALSSRIRKLIFVFKKLRHVAEPYIIKTVYLALCQSLLVYCITAWGGAAKTLLLKLECAQRTILKVGWKLPFMYPTTNLFKNCDVLTVRQLFILHTILKAHSLVVFNPTSFANVRRQHLVYPPFAASSSFAQRFFCFLSGYLYNKINYSLVIYGLCRFDCKHVVTNWLLRLDYCMTENLLTVLS